MLSENGQSREYSADPALTRALTGSPGLTPPGPAAGIRLHRKNVGTKKHKELLKTADPNVTSLLYFYILIILTNQNASAFGAGECLPRCRARSPAAVRVGHARPQTR